MKELAICLDGGPVFGFLWNLLMITFRFCIFGKSINDTQCVFLNPSYQKAHDVVGSIIGHIYSDSCLSYYQISPLRVTTLRSCKYPVSP